MTTRTAYPTEFEDKTSSAKVLVLDDESCIAELLSEMLQLLGFSPTTCYSPVTALEMLAQQDFDVVLSDFRMPQMNGDEFFRRAVTANPSLKSRIVFLTGDIMSEETRRLFSGGRSRHLSKPFDITAVQQVISDVVKEHLHARAGAFGT
ncbi:MAG: response regulator, partial [Limisphaerales bacterium]